MRINIISSPEPWLKSILVTKYAFYLSMVLFKFLKAYIKFSGSGFTWFHLVSLGKLARNKNFILAVLLFLFYFL